MAGELEDFWRQMPLVTKYLFAGSLLFTIAANFNIIPGYYLYLDFSKLYQRFEIWRLVTAFLFHGKLGFPFLMNLVFLVRYGASVEQNTFGGNTADYLFFILFTAVCLLVPAFLLPMYILGKSLIFAIIYYWSRKVPDAPMSFFMINFPSVYFPWVLIGFRLLVGESPIDEIIGVIIGHAYFFLSDVYPLQSGQRYLNTPQFLKDLFPAQGGGGGGGGGGGFVDGGARPNGPPQGGYNWGRGQRLGD